MADIQNIDLSNNLLVSELRERRIKELTNVLVRQTDMKYDEALLALEKNNYDLIKTLRQYLQNGNENKDIENRSKSKTVNQMIYSEIRQTMDKASINFLRRQEFQRAIQNQRQRIEELRRAGVLENCRQEIKNNNETDINDKEEVEDEVEVLLDNKNNMDKLD